MEQMEKDKIQIDLEVHKKIEALRISFSETPNDILRRILGLAEHSKTPQAQGNASKAVWMPAPNVKLLEGTKLYARYKGRPVEAEVVQGGLKYNGTIYKSPSAAACAVTGNSVNGWNFWEVQEGTERFRRPLSSLRR